MSAKRKTIDRLLALPYVHARDDAAFVRVPYQDAQGKWRSKEKKLPPAATPEDAINLIASIKSTLNLTPQVYVGERMAFDDLLTAYTKAHPKIPRWYIAPLSFFAGRKLRSLTYADCERYKESREQVAKADGTPRKPATINRELEILRRILLFAVRHDWLLRSPFNAGPTLISKAEEERRDRIPTPEEEARLLSVCVPPRAHLRGLILATRDTGLRRSALFSLTWAMVDFENQLLRVPSGNRYKRRPKIIGLSRRLYDELRQLWEASDKQPSMRVFKVSDNFRRSYKTACRLAKVEGLRFNDLRHGFATDLMEADIPQRLAMKMAGHVNADTHDIYTNVDERIARQVADALNKLHELRRGAGFSVVGKEEAAA